MHSKKINIAFFFITLYIFKTKIIIHSHKDFYKYINFIREGKKLFYYFTNCAKIKYANFRN